MMDHTNSILSLDTGNRSDSVLDQICINALRVLAMDAVQRANSGHPGLQRARADEMAWAWRVALAMRDRSVALVLSRQDLPIFDRAGLRLADAEGVVRGAYVLDDAPGDPSTPLDFV